MQNEQKLLSVSAETTSNFSAYWTKLGKWQNNDLRVMCLLLPIYVPIESRSDGIVQRCVSTLVSPLLACCIH